MRHHCIHNAFLGLSILLLAACGGGGSSSAPPPPPPPPVVTDVVALGPLADAAGFTVNGRSYATGASNVEINGSPGAVSNLKAGQIVRVRGQSTGGTSATAFDIEYDANVIGPIDSVDLAQGVIVVMGQQVHVFADTILDAAIGDQSVGLTAEVSGHVDAFDQIAATRIDLVTATGRPRIQGKAVAVDNANFVFRINGLTLNFSAATVIDVQGGALSNNMEVIALGSLDSGGVLNVSEIHELNRDTVDFAGFAGSLTGIVTRFVSNTDFDVAGIRIVGQGQTQFVGGNAGDLRLGSSVRIEGNINASGWLAVSQVWFSGVATSVQTVDFAIDNFTKVEVGGPFLTTIDQGPDFVVRLTVDSAVVPLLDVRREGSALKVGFQDNVNINASTLRVHVEMPNLDSLVLAGATRATATGFAAPHLQVLLAGAVFLDVNDSTYDTLDANLAGACALLMDGSRLDTSANVTLVGASTATVNLMPNASLRGSTIAASALLYYGDNIDVDVSNDLTSTVMRLGGGR